MWGVATTHTPPEVHSGLRAAKDQSGTPPLPVTGAGDQEGPERTSTAGTQRP